MPTVRRRRTDAELSRMANNARAYNDWAGRRYATDQRNYNRANRRFTNLMGAISQEYQRNMRSASRGGVAT